MSRVFLNFEEKVKIFSERAKHKQSLEGLKVHNMFKNQQVGKFRWWMMGNWEKKLQRIKLRG